MRGASERKDGDLPLLGWKPPPKVVPFPAKHRPELVMRTANYMASLPDEERATDYLLIAVGALLDRYHAIGVDEGAAERDAADFYAAVIARYYELAGVAL